MKNKDSVKKEKTNTRFWIFYHAGILAFSFAAAFLMKYRQLGNPFDPTVAVTIFVIFFTSVNIGYLAIFMLKRSERYDYGKLAKRVLPILVSFYIAAFLIADIAVTLGLFGWYLFNKMSFSGFFDTLFNNDLRFANRQFVVWLLVCTIVFFYSLWNLSLKREKLLAEENLMYRYNTLRSHLNPHFLFNSLTTLSELIYSDTKRADRFIQKLSGIYRYILENEEADVVPLTNELKFVEEYFELQKERDNGRIALKIEVSRPGLYNVIPVSLQMLVENAFKHNSMSLENPLIINIFDSDDMIVVSNVLQRKSIAENNSHTGLQNLNERVRLITGKEIEIAEENRMFVVRLPLIRI